MNTQKLIYLSYFACKKASLVLLLSERADILSR